MNNLHFKNLLGEQMPVFGNGKNVENEFIFNCCERKLINLAISNN